MAPLYRIIDDYDPLRILVQISPTTDENLRAYLDEQLAEMQRNRSAGRRTVVVIEASLDRRPSPAQRKMQADWINEHASLLGASCLGIAFVVASPIVRGALTAIFWVASMPIPHTVHGTIEAAVAWALGELAHARIELPAHLATADERSIAARVRAHRPSASP